MIGDVEKMVVVGLVWGATNAAIRRGALLWDQTLNSRTNSPPRLNHSSFGSKISDSIRDWTSFLLFWQYSVPFLINLSASASFFALLSDAPISLAVPVTNATTFAATAVFGMVFGEEIHAGLAFLGTLFIVLGVWLCIST